MINVIINIFERKGDYSSLKNIGATCYMNSILQCLLNIDPFRYDLMVTNSELITSPLLEENTIYLYVFLCIILIYHADTEKNTQIYRYCQCVLLFRCFFFHSSVLQILSLLQDRQSTQSQNNTTTQLTDDERTVESQALINLKKAVEKHSGVFLGSRQQVSRLLRSIQWTRMFRFRLNSHIYTLK